jgi:hypothetical protein
MSKFLSWLAVTVAALVTALWAVLVARGNYCWGAFAFTVLAAQVGGGIVLFGVVPTGVRYLRTRQRGELMNLLRAGGSFAAVLVETALLWVIPQGGE